MCKSLRARLGSVTENFKWAVISGKHFAYEFGRDEPECQLLAEYKFYYQNGGAGPKKAFHVLVYNKDGIYTPALQGLLKRIKRDHFGGGFAKTAMFCLMILGYFWVNSRCRTYSAAKASGSAVPSPLSKFSMDTICEYKNTFFFSMALIFVVTFAAGNMFKQIGALRRRKLLTQGHKR